MKMTPCGNRVLLKEVKIEEVEKDGLFIPAMSSPSANKIVKMEVVAVGEGKFDEFWAGYQMKFAVGDIVLVVPSDGGYDIMESGVKHLLIDADNVLAKFVDGEQETVF